MAFIKPTSPFRSAWQYNNLMFLAAGYAAGKRAGSIWEELVRTRIFEPLGMSTANFRVEDARKLPDYATPHVLRPNGEAGVAPWRPLDNIGPGGSINACAAELVRWVRLHLNGGTFETLDLREARGRDADSTDGDAAR